MIYAIGSSPQIKYLSLQLAVYMRYDAMLHVYQNKRESKEELAYLLKRNVFYILSATRS